MMQVQFDIRFDTASAISQGRRDSQEDALITDFPIGGQMGIAVLADGMGGHAGGAVASKIAVTEVFSELKFHCADPDAFQRQPRKVLHDALVAANACIADQVRENQQVRGMGTTLVALVVMPDRLFWVSVGDSPLYLFRKGRLVRLNQIHSLAPQIDLMVKSGAMSEAVGLWHPDRHCLTSVVGGGKIAKIDLPATPMALNDGDLLILASDGLETLSREELQDFLIRHQLMDSAEIAQRLLREVDAYDDPEQDNLALSVIRILGPSRARNKPGKGPRMVADRGHRNGKLTKTANGTATKAAGAVSALRPVRDFLSKSVKHEM